MSSDGCATIERELRVDAFKMSSETPKAWPALKEGSALGCGCFGCVYATSDKSIVVKLTKSKHEAEFAALCLRWKASGNKVPEGIVSYHAVADLGGTWALWRDSVKRPDGFWGFEPEFRAYDSQRTSPAVFWTCAYTSAARRLRDVLEELSGRQAHPAGLRKGDPTRGVAASLVRAKADIPDEYMTVLGAARRAAAVVMVSGVGLLESTTRENLTKEARSGFGVCRVAASLLGAFGKGKEPVLADALLWFWDHGIVFTDVHPGNVGAHMKTGAPVVFDSGRALAIEPVRGSFAYGGEDVSVEPISRLKAEDWLP